MTHRRFFRRYIGGDYDYFRSHYQGIIQGATEFLPVSSSGHLSISKHLFGIEMPGILFDVMLHLGTLIAVVFVYRELIWRLIKEFGALCVDIAHRNFKWSEMNQDRRLIFMLIIGLVPLFLLFLPIPGTGMDIKGLSDMLGSDSDIVVEGLALLATSALLFAGIAANKQMKESHRRKDASGRIVTSKGRKKIHTVDRHPHRHHPVCGGCVPGAFPVWLHAVGRLAPGH